MIMMIPRMRMLLMMAVAKKGHYSESLSISLLCHPASLSNVFACQKWSGHLNDDLPSMAALCLPTGVFFVQESLPTNAIVMNR